jgi:Na+-translocating ferredoxin:NAD+ oxidoreductase subunit B
MGTEKDINSISRRDFFRKGMQCTVLLGVGGLSAALISKTTAGKMVWQIDTKKCTQCGRCALNCVKTPSAVKCIHAYDLCGYCDLCGGYFRPGVINLTTAAENQLCPTSAIKRKFIEEPFFEYDIDKKLCIGCSKCVKGCGSFGNGSLQLQIDQSLCDNCNDCSIARNCPSNATSRIDASKPYLMLGLRENNQWKNKS